jgi:hypothetical protein
VDGTDSRTWKESRAAGRRSESVDQRLLRILACVRVAAHGNSERAQASLSTVHDSEEERARQANGEGDKASGCEKSIVLHSETGLFEKLAPGY